MDAKTFDKRATALVGPFLSSYGIAPEDFHLHCLKIGRIYRFRASHTKRVFDTPSKYPRRPTITLFEARGREDCLWKLSRLKPKTVAWWAKRHRTSIDSVIRATGWGGKIGHEERELWVANDESLYLWAKSEGVSFE